MYQMIAALMQIQSLRQRISADKDDTILLGTAFRRAGANGFRIGAADG